MRAKWKAAVSAIACMRLAATVVGGLCCAVLGGVSVSLSGMAGWFRIVTAWSNVAPRSGLPIPR